MLLKVLWKLSKMQWFWQNRDLSFMMSRAARKVWAAF